jgi:ornithine cyclodeaminase
MIARWISEAEVAAVLDLRAAIAGIEAGLVAEASGAAENMPKTHVQWGDGNSLHAIGGAFTVSGIVGTKTWAHTAQGATPLLILFDADSGALRAVIEAFALGQLRTGAVSAVATRWLAAETADELAIIGSGRQALAQVAAVAAVRRLHVVRVFSPTAAHREAFAERVRDELGLAARAAASVAEAVDGAPIVTLATRARQPFLHAAMLAHGAHVNAIGAITPERVEFSGDVFARCDSVAVDSVPAVQGLSREFRDHYGSRGDWGAVMPLSQIVAGAARRKAATDLTLCKAMGVGLSDVAVGIELMSRAERTGRGRPLAQPEHVKINWGRGTTSTR